MNTSTSNNELARPALPSNRAGYWISPGRKFFLVEGTHIDTVCNHPTKFGTTEEHLKAVFEQYNERYASEGDARKHIIHCLVWKGWIRIRNYANQGWTFNISRMTFKMKMRITDFLTQVYGARTVYDDACIDFVQGQYKTDVMKILRYDLFGGTIPKTYSRQRLRFIPNASLIPDNEVVEVKLEGNEERNNYAGKM